MFHLGIMEMEINSWKMIFQWFFMEVMFDWRMGMEIKHKLVSNNFNQLMVSPGCFG